MFLLSVVPERSGGGAQAISREFVKSLIDVGDCGELFLFEPAVPTSSRSLRWFYALRRLLKVFKRNRPVVVVSHLDGALFAVAILSIFYRHNFSHVFHGPPTAFNGLRGLVYEWLKKLSVKRLDLCIFVSSDQEIAHLAIYPGLMAKRRVVLRNPFIRKTMDSKLAEDIDFLKIERAKGRSVLILPGRLCEQKNQEFLIRVLKERMDLGRAELLLFAGDGPLRGHLMALAFDAGLRVGETLKQAATSDLLFLGHRPDVQSLIKNSDAVLLPSRYEGYPLALVESICLSVPVVSTDCPTGPKEIFQELQCKLGEIEFQNSNLLTLMPLRFDEEGVSLWVKAIDRVLNMAADIPSLVVDSINEIFDSNSYRNRLRDIYVAEFDVRK